MKKYFQKVTMLFFGVHKNNPIFRAIALVLLLTIAVTMLTSCDNGPEPSTGNNPPHSSSNPGGTESNPSSDPVPSDKTMTATEYFSELRLLKTGTGDYSFKDTQTSGGMTLSLPMCGDTVLADVPVSGINRITSQGIVFSVGQSDIMYLLSKDGVFTLFQVPWMGNKHGQEVIEEIGAADEDVIFFRTTNYGYPKTMNKIRRYYFAEQKCDVVLDLLGTEITAYLDRWQGEITEWQAINNQEIVLTVRPMHEYEETSKAYKTFLNEEYARLTDDADAQKTVAAIRDGQSTEAYRPMIVYNTEHKTYQVLYTLAQQKDYLSKSDVAYTGPKQEPAETKPVVQKGTVSGKVMSYKEYFSKMRILWKEDGHDNYTNRSEKVPPKNAVGFAMTMFAYYGDQKLSALPMSAPWRGTASGMLMANNDSDGAQLLQQTKDGVECLIQFPAGTRIEAISDADSHAVLFSVSTGSITHRTQYIYRYFIPEAKLELVVDTTAGKVNELIAQHQGAVTSWRAYSNEDVLVKVTPMFNVSMKSEEYLAYLKSEIQRHKNNPAVQNYIQYVIDHDIKHGGPGYHFYVAHNLRTGKVTVMHTYSEYTAYQNSFNVNMQNP